MTTTEIRDAAKNLRWQSQALDEAAQSVASVLIGRLRKCPPDDLVEIKKELRRFNIAKKKWLPEVE